MKLIIFLLTIILSYDIISSQCEQTEGIMSITNKDERLIESWITLSGIFKNSRFTTGLHYNEAIIMNIVYKRYLEDGEGIVSVKEIIKKTRMLKSLVNRTVNSLLNQGLVEKCEHGDDKRVVHIKCSKDKTNMFLSVHSSSLSHAQNIINIIGEDDTDAFIRIVDKLEKSGYSI